MNHDDLLPKDRDQATLLGRVFDPAVGGPCLVHLRGDVLVDVTAAGPTVSALLEGADPVAALHAAPDGRSWPLAEVLDNSLARRHDQPHLLAPCDLQAVKACGVTFARSMVERVIEERARGDFRRRRPSASRSATPSADSCGTSSPARPKRPTPRRC